MKFTFLALTTLLSLGMVAPASARERIIIRRSSNRIEIITPRSRRDYHHSHQQRHHRHPNYRYDNYSRDNNLLYRQYSNGQRIYYRRYDDPARYERGRRIYYRDYR